MTINKISHGETLNIKNTLFTVNQHHRLPCRDRYTQASMFEAIRGVLAGRPGLGEFIRSNIGQREGQPNGVGGRVEKDAGLPAAQRAAEGVDRVGGVEGFERAGSQHIVAMT